MLPSIRPAAASIGKAGSMSAASMIPSNIAFSVCATARWRSLGAAPIAAASTASFVAK